MNNKVHPDVQKAMQELPPEVRAAVECAISTQGKRAGLLLKNCPKTGTKGAVAWQALVANIAPIRFSVWRAVCFLPDEWELCNKIDKWAEKHHHVLNLHLQRPFEFNLHHYHYATE